MLDRRIRWLAAAFLVLFLILVAQVNYLQVFAADRLKNNPANAPRLLRQEYDVQRGEILARDGRCWLGPTRSCSRPARPSRWSPRRQRWRAGRSRARPSPTPTSSTCPRRTTR